MTKIIGHKLETWDAATKRPRGGALVISHERLFELHATKGWRCLYHKKRARVARHMPLFWGKVKSSFHRKNAKAPRPDAVEMTEIARERMLMRHGWYRRKLRKEAENAA